MVGEQAGAWLRRCSELLLDGKGVRGWACCWIMSCDRGGVRLGRWRWERAGGGTRGTEHKDKAGGDAVGARGFRGDTVAMDTGACRRGPQGEARGDGVGARGSRCETVAMEAGAHRQGGGVLLDCEMGRRSARNDGSARRGEAWNCCS